MNGFPALAVEYIRPAYRAHPGDPTSGLLLARALVAAGDVDGAREVVHDLGPQSESLVVGQRIELARAYFLTGDVGWARRLLEKDIEESVGLMMRDSILTNVTFKEGRWPEAATAFADAKRKAPATLGDKRVSRAWRNLQREVWSIQLRRAIALWNAGKHEDAVDEASAAQEADEEYVRSGAILFVSAARLVSGLRGDALVRLHALAGHDVRFKEPIAHLDEALAKGGDLAGAIAGVRAALSAEDRAQDFVTAPLFEIVTTAVRGTKPTRTESASR